MKIDNKEEFIKYKMDYLDNLLAENKYYLVSDERKEVALAMERIVNFGNSFILNDYYLHYFAYEALEEYLLYKSNNKLLNLLEEFETNNEDELHNYITIMYSHIHSCCQWYKSSKITDALRLVFTNSVFPLIKEYDEVVRTLLESEYCDYAIFSSIINCIIVYCVIHEKNDYFMNYINFLLNDKVSLLDDLLFHDIITEDIVRDQSDYNYHELRKYVRYRLDNCDIERKKLK